MKDSTWDARHVLAVQEDVALEGARQTRERMHDGRLTAAGPPHQTHDLTDTEPEGDITDNDWAPVSHESVRRRASRAQALSPLLPRLCPTSALTLSFTYRSR